MIAVQSMQSIRPTSSTEPGGTTSHNGTQQYVRGCSKADRADRGACDTRDPMNSYFAGLVDFVGAHPQLSFLAVFLLALSEAVPVIGTVVPGSTLILAISALVTAAGITPWALLVAAVLGAIAGDGFSFWLGHRYRRQILSGWPLNRFPWLIERSARFIRKYGITSVFLARFTAVVRAFVPLLAGIMSSRHFY